MSVRLGYHSPQTINMAKKTEQIPQPGFTLSFLLGGNDQEALESLSGIKDAMAAAIMMKQEDELAIDDQTANYCRQFYQAADIQYRQLLSKS